MSNLLNKVADALNPGRQETNNMLYGTGQGSHFPHGDHMPGEFPDTPAAESTANPMGGEHPAGGTTTTTGQSSQQGQGSHLAAAATGTEGQALSGDHPATVPESEHSVKSDTTSAPFAGAAGTTSGLRDFKEAPATTGQHPVTVADVEPVSKHDTSSAAPATAVGTTSAARNISETPATTSQHPTTVADDEPVSTHNSSSATPAAAAVGAGVGAAGLAEAVGAHKKERGEASAPSAFQSDSAAPTTSALSSSAAAASAGSHPVTSTTNTTSSSSTAQPFGASSGLTNAAFAPAAVQNLREPAAGSTADDASTASIKSGVVGYPTNSDSTSPIAGSNALIGGTSTSAPLTSAGASLPEPGTSTTTSSNPTTTGQEHDSHLGRNAAVGAGALGAAGVAAYSLSDHDLARHREESADAEAALAESKRAGNNQSGSSAARGIAPNAAFDEGATPIGEKDFGSAAITHDTSTARSYPLGVPSAQPSAQTGSGQYGSAAVAPQETARSYPLGSSSAADSQATSQDHHYGRDAAIAGVGAGAAGAAAAKHEHDKELTGPVHDSNVLNKLDPRVKEVDAGKQGTSAATTTDDSHARRNFALGGAGVGAGAASTAAGHHQQTTTPTTTTTQQTEQPEKQHHYGRDAAVVGAGGVAAHEVSKHHEKDEEADPEKKKGGLLSKIMGRNKDDKETPAEEHSTKAGGLAYVPPTGTRVGDATDGHNTATTPAVAPSTAAHTDPTVAARDEHDSHRGLAAAGAGVGAGALGYEAAKHHHNQQEQTPLAAQRATATHPAAMESSSADNAVKPQDQPYRYEHMHHPVRDTAVAGTAGGVAAHEAGKHHDKHHEKHDDSPTRTGSDGEKKQGFFSKLIHGRKGEDLDASGEKHETSRERHETRTTEEGFPSGAQDDRHRTLADIETAGEGHHHYLAESAAVGGVGAAAVGAKHHHDTEKEREAASAGSTPQRKESLLHRLTHRKKSPDRAAEAPKHEEGHHYARDAGLAGAGLGAGGLATHEAAKHHEHHDAAQTTVPTTTTQAHDGLTDRHAAQPTARIAAEPAGHHYARDAAIGGTAGAVGVGALHHHQQQSAAAAAPLSSTTQHTTTMGSNMDDPTLKQTGAVYPHPAAGDNSDVGYGMMSSQPAGGIEGTPASTSAIKSQEEEKIEESNKHMHHSSLLNKLDPRVKTDVAGDTGAAGGTAEHHVGRDTAALGGAAAVAEHEHHKHHGHHHGGQTSAAGATEAPALGVDPADPYRHIPADHVAPKTDIPHFTDSNDLPRDPNDKKEWGVNFWKRDAEFPRERTEEPGYQKQQREYHDREVEHVEQIAAAHDGPNKLRKPPPPGYGA